MQHHSPSPPEEEPETLPLSIPITMTEREAVGDSDDDDEDVANTRLTAYRRIVFSPINRHLGSSGKNDRTFSVKVLATCLLSAVLLSLVTSRNVADSFENTISPSSSLNLDSTGDQQRFMQTAETSGMTNDLDDSSDFTLSHHETGLLHKATVAIVPPTREQRLAKHHLQQTPTTHQSQRRDQQQREEEEAPGNKMALTNPAHHLSHSHRVYDDSIVYRLSTEVVNPVAAAGAPPTQQVEEGRSPRKLRDARETIAYALVVTRCAYDSPLHDGAAVLARTVALNSYDNPYSSSNYRFKLYAIVHSNAAECSSNYAKLGYEVLIKPNVVDLDEIEPGFFKSNVETKCGRRGGLAAFTPLWAYALTDHPAVVVLDAEEPTMFIRPLDELFDSMILGDEAADGDGEGAENARAVARAKIKVHQRTTIDAAAGNAREGAGLSASITPEAFFTRDYVTVKQPRDDVVSKAGVNTGLIVIKPSAERFAHLQEMIRAGNYGGEHSGNGGWNGSGYGRHKVGGMCTRGLLSYYFGEILQESAVELNRCYYNSMGESTTLPMFEGTPNKCRDGRDSCDDCRSMNLAQLKVANMAICRKPWTCEGRHDPKNPIFDLCREMVMEWFKLRGQVEEEWAETVDGYTPTDLNGSYFQYYFRGFCNNGSPEGYIPLSLP